mgnify:CR=1 FL=1
MFKSKTVQTHQIWLACAILFVSTFIPTIFFQRLSYTKDFYGVDGRPILAAAHELAQGKEYFAYFRSDEREMIGHINIRKMLPGFTPAWILLHVPAVKLGISPSGLLTILAMVAALSLAFWFYTFIELVHLLEIELSLGKLGFFLLLAIFFLPFHEALFMGQPTPIVCLLVTRALFHYLKQNDCWSALLIAVAGIIKIFPATMLLLFVLKRKWRATALGLTVLLLAQLPLLAINSNVLTSFLEESSRFAKDKTNRLLFMGVNKSIKAICLRLFDSLVLGNLLCLSLLIGATIICYRAKDGSFWTRANCYQILWIAVLLQTPCLWRHHFSMVALCYFLFATLRPKWSAFFVVLLYLDVAPDLVAGLSFNHPPSLISILVLAIYYLNKLRANKD